MTEANGKEVARARVTPPRLPYDDRIEERFGIDIGGWRALTDAIFPSASTTDAIILALSYCKARKLDPFKKPVQIVPMWDDKRKMMVDTVWPGIGELRTTAFRTGQYAGRDAAIFGDDHLMEKLGEASNVRFPEWCEIVVYRLIGGVRVPFHGPRVHWLEIYATKKDKVTPNAMWSKRPNGQLEKCAEAAALRAAFPEELGNEYAADEMEGKIIDHGDADAGLAPTTIGVPKQINSRQAKIADLWPPFEAEVRAFTDLDALEDWWRSGATQTRVSQMSPKWQEQATEEFEKAQEKLGNAMNLEREEETRADG